MPYRKKQTQLQAVHGQATNLSLLDKLLANRLTAHEWLTEVDIASLLKVCGINDPYIGPLSHNDIGYKLHRARLQHQNDTPVQPYHVPMVINCGQAGSALDQGAHWVNAMVTIDPTTTPGLVTFDYQDSFNLTPENKHKIEHVLREAARYPRNLNAAPEDKDFRAFPSYKVQCHIEGKSSQHDAWSCGYRATKALIDQCYAYFPQPPTSAWAKKFHQCPVASFDLRDLAYELLISQAAIDSSKYQSSMIDGAAFLFDRVSHSYRFTNTFYAYYLTLISNTHDNNIVSADLDLQALSDQSSISINKNQHLAQLNSLLPGCLSNNEPFRELSIERLETVLPYIHEASQIAINQAHLQALAQFIIDNNVNSLQITDLGQLPNVWQKQLAQALAHSTSLTTVYSVNDLRLADNDQLNQLEPSLLRLLKRNQLFHHVGLQFATDGNPWQQFWLERFSNSTFFQDYALNKGFLSLLPLGCLSAENGIPEFQSELYNLIKAAYDDYCTSLLSTLQAWQSNNDDFPFERLDFNLGQESDEQLLKRSLQLLNEFLANQSTVELPVSHLEITLFSMDDESFALFKQLLHLCQKTNLSSLDIIYFDRREKVSLLSTQQLLELQQMYKQYQYALPITLQYPTAKLEQLKHTDFDNYSAYFDLINTISQNKRAHQSVPQVVQDSIITTKRDDSDNKQYTQEAKPTLLRPCKVTHDASWVVESSLEQTTDIQHDQEQAIAYDQAHELQQEATTAIEAQQQADINFFTPAVTSELPDDFTQNASLKNTWFNASQGSSRGKFAQHDIFKVFDIDESFELFADNLLGTRILPKSIRYVTHQAISKVINHFGNFMSGLHIDNLPPGFSVCTTAEHNELVLEYDIAQHAANSTTPLTTLLEKNHLLDNWTGDLRQFIPNAADLGYDIPSFGGIFVDPYATPKVEAATWGLFEHCLIGLSDPATKDYIVSQHSWCLPSETSVDSAILFKPGSDLFILMDVLYRQGISGLQALLDTLKQVYDQNPSLYQFIKDYFITRQYDIAHLQGTPEQISAIHSLLDKQLSQAQMQWFKALASNEIEQLGYANLSTLVEAFVYFLDQLPSNIVLPLPCPIIDPDQPNMQVVLDRLLAILSQVPKRNLKDQFNHLQNLDYSAEGAWYASRWEGFYFFHEAMALTPTSLTDPAYQQIEEAVLQRSQPSYRVDLAQLQAFALTQKQLSETQYQYACILWHRWLGCCECIHKDYHYYTHISDAITNLDELSTPIKLQALCLLAVATTGLRGANGDDYQPFLTLLQTQIKSDAEALNATLVRLIKVIDQLKPEFNVTELTALTQYLLELSEAQQSNLLDNLQQNDNTQTYQALLQWSYNPQHIPAKTLQHYQQMAGDTAYWPLIWQVLSCCNKQNSHDDECQKLLAQLEKLEKLAPDNYPAILKLLGSIDCQNTASEVQLTLRSLNELIEIVLTKELTTTSSVYSLLRHKHPSLHIQPSLSTTSTTVDFDANLAEEIERLNLSMQKFGLEPWDVQQLAGNTDDVAHYINNRYAALYQDLASKLSGSFMTVKMVWPQIKQHINDLLTKVFLARVDKAIQTMPQLAIAQCSFDQPKLNFHNPDKVDDAHQISLGDSAIVQKHYGQQLGELLELIINCHKTWGSAFDISRLFKSPRITNHQFDIQQITDILSHLQRLNLKSTPGQLLNLIFASTSLSEAVSSQSYTYSICALLKTSSLSLADKTRLIAVIKNYKQLQSMPSLLNKLASTEGGSLIELCLQKTPDSVPVDIPIMITVYDYVYQLYHYDPDSITRLFKYTPYNIYQLYNILDVVAQLTQASSATQIGLINILTYCQSDRPLDTLTLLTEWLNQRQQDLKAIIDIYQGSPPYPSMSQLHTWLNINATDNLQAKLREHELDPHNQRHDQAAIDKQFDNTGVCGRLNEWRDLTRGQFIANEYGVRGSPMFYTHRAQLAEQMTYINEIGCRRGLLLPGISGQQKQRLQLTGDPTPPVMKLTRYQIKELMNHYRSILSNPQDFAQETVAVAQCEMAALAREAMYRSHKDGIFPYSTQMLALLNMIRDGGSSISEIRTGEGKGIITALFAVAQWMTGSVVDVCSANMELAKRDLQEFKNFFEYLGISSTLIEANSRASDYPQGINYSTVAQKTLFDEKCLTEGDKLPDQASLVLDEADRILDDTTHYRFATSLDPQFNPWVNPYEWAYPVLLDFVTPVETFKSNDRTKEQDIQDLKDFVLDPQNTPELTPQQRSSFLDIPDQQLDMWIDSAVVALSLELDEDYVIRTKPDPRATEDSGDLVSMAVLRDREQHRLMPESRLSNGAQQLLHTHLNRKRGANSPPFLIEPEKTYLASRSGKNFIDSYLRQGRGQVAGLTGTCGKAELKTLYDYGFHCYQVPPHRSLNRADQPVLLAKDQRRKSARKQQLDYILEEAKSASQRGQSILIIGQGITDSQAIYNYLQKFIDAAHLQLYNGEQDVPEAQVVDKAGQKGMITVSTPMLGRGTDIKPTASPGLHVISTFIAGEREYWQHVGRSGRNGAHGSSRLIIQASDLAHYCQRYNKPMPTETEAITATIQSIRLELAAQKEASLTESQAVADLKDQFFQQYCELASNIKNQMKQLGEQTRSDYRSHWQTLHKILNLTWNSFLTYFDELWNKQVVALRNPETDLTLEAAIDEQRRLAEQQWQTTYQQLVDQAQHAAQTLTSDNDKPLDLSAKPEVIQPRLESIAPPYYASQGIDIDTRPLAEELTNSVAVYYQVKQQLQKHKSLTAKEQQDALHAELNSMSQMLGLEPVSNNLDEQANGILQTLLNQRARAYFYNSPKPSQSHLYQRLMRVIAQWADKSIQSSLKQRHIDHIESINNRFFFNNHPQYTSYMEQLLADIHYYNQQGSFGSPGLDIRDSLPKAKLGSQGAVQQFMRHNPHFSAYKSQRVHPKAPTQEPKPIKADWIKEWVAQGLDRYSHTIWPLPNASRRRQIKRLRTAINQQFDDESEYIQNLLQTISNAQSSIAHDDLVHDCQAKNSWWPFARFRNSKTGGRLQSLLNNMHSRVSLYAAQKQLEFDFSPSINAVKDLLGSLLERAHLLGSTDTAYTDLQSLQALLNQELEPWQQQQLLTLISQKISNWQDAFESQLIGKKSATAEQKAFQRALQQNQQQIDAVITTFKVTAKTQPSDELDHLQQDLSEAFNQVLHSDAIKQQSLSLDEFKNKVTIDPNTEQDDQTDEQVHLLANLLHETKRLFLLHTPNAQHFECSPVVYKPGQSSIDIKGHFTVPINQNDHAEQLTHSFKITVQPMPLTSNSFIQLSRPIIHRDLPSAVDVHTDSALTKLKTQSSSTVVSDAQYFQNLMASKLAFFTKKHNGYKATGNTLLNKLSDQGESSAGPSPIDK